VPPGNRNRQGEGSLDKRGRLSLVWVVETLLHRLCHKEESDNHPFLAGEGEEESQLPVLSTAVLRRSVVPCRHFCEVPLTDWLFVCRREKNPALSQESAGGPDLLTGPVHPFGSLAALSVPLGRLRAHSFASPPHDGFAFIEDGPSRRPTFAVVAGPAVASTGHTRTVERICRMCKSAAIFLLFLLQRFMLS